MKVNLYVGTDGTREARNATDVKMPGLPAVGDIIETYALTTATGPDAANQFFRVVQRIWDVNDRVTLHLVRVLGYQQCVIACCPNTALHARQNEPQRCALHLVS